MPGYLSAFKLPKDEKDARKTKREIFCLCQKKYEFHTSLNAEISKSYRSIDAGIYSNGDISNVD